MEVPVTAVAVVAAVGAALAVALAVWALAGQRRTKRAARVLIGGDRDDALELLQRQVEEIRRLRAEVAAIAEKADHLRELVAGAVSRVGVVRYDAFDDVGGRLSYSAALLDERGDGVVVSAINGRADSRAYAKQVTGGRSEQTLSEEEAEAVARAMRLEQRSGSWRAGEHPPAGPGVATAGGDVAEVRAAGSDDASSGGGRPGRDGGGATVDEPSGWRGGRGAG